jgi:steroid delta-isomerase-like uncharacterized protein
MEISNFSSALKLFAHELWKLVKFILGILGTILLIAFPLGLLQKAIEYHWAWGFPVIAFLACVVYLSIRDFKEGRINMRQGVGALVGLLLLTVSIFAFLSLALFKLGVAHYQGFPSQGIDNHVMGTLLEFYTWQLFGIIPALNINEALGWTTSPLQKSGFWAGILLLTFRVVIIFVVLDVFRKWWAKLSSVERNKALVRRWFEEVWNQGRADAISEMFAAEGIAHGLLEESQRPLKGAAGFKPFHENFRGAFPDIQVIVEDVIAEGDKVVARCSVRGTHTGDHLGVVATNSTVEFTGMTIARIMDGKIVEAWNNFDFLRMNKQIGVS